MLRHNVGGLKFWLTFYLCEWWHFFVMNPSKIFAAAVWGLGCFLRHKHIRKNPSTADTDSHPETSSPRSRTDSTLQKRCWPKEDSSWPFAHGAISVGVHDNGSLDVPGTSVGVKFLPEEIDQWKKTWLFAVYRGWHPTQLYGDYFINHCKDPY